MEKNDQKPTNPKDVVSTNRLDLSIFPQTAIIYGALAMTEGLTKYSAYNYRVAGAQVMVYVSALLRHIFKYVNGQWADPKTTVPHLANAEACLAILIDGHEQGNIIDDRPPAVDVDKLLSECEAIVAHLRKTFPPEKCIGPGRWTEKNKGTFTESSPEKKEEEELSPQLKHFKEVVK